MADPSPPVYLPEYEYLEVFNRSSHEINHSGWTLLAGSRRFVLGDKIIPPGHYQLICSMAARLIIPTVCISPVLTSSSALPNSGQVLILRNHLEESSIIVLFRLVV